jgi:hypothetical protein
MGGDTKVIFLAYELTGFVDVSIVGFVIKNSKCLITCGFVIKFVVFMVLNGHHFK